MNVLIKVDRSRANQGIKEVIFIRNIDQLLTEFEGWWEEVDPEIVSIDGIIGAKKVLRLDRTFDKEEEWYLIEV